MLLVTISACLPVSGLVSVYTALYNNIDTMVLHLNIPVDTT